MKENKVTARSGQLHSFHLGISIRLHDYYGNKLPNNKYLIEYGGKRKEGQSDEEGFIRIAIISGIERCKINWDPVIDESGRIQSYNYKSDYFLNIMDINSEDGIKRRLHNIGYSIDGSYQSNLLDFQSHYDLEVTGTADEATLNKLKEIYDKAQDGAEKEFESDQDEASDDDVRT